MYEVAPRRVTLVVIGQTGAGKSELLNGYLQIMAFRSSPSPMSCTTLTSSAENLVLGVLRTGIDTQGISDTQGVDAEHVEQMMSFLKQWEHGVNAFAIVINVHADRLDQGTQKLIKYVHQFFNDATFWNHTCIVFTKCYDGVPIDKDIKRTQYRNELLRIVRECPGGESAMPELPVFFVDSPKWREDPETSSELVAMHAFILTHDALPTHDLAAPSTDYLRVEKETRNDVLVDTQILGPEGAAQERIQTFEDQEREKRTAYDGRTITYSDWTATRRWDISSKSEVRMERQKVCVSEVTRDITVPINDDGNPRVVIPAAIASTTTGAAIAGPPGAAIGLVIGLASRLLGTRCGGRGMRVVGQKVTRTFHESERVVTTDFDGNVTYSDWKIIHVSSEET